MRALRDLTGHPDHQAASAAARRVARARGPRVLEWGMSPDVAPALRAERARLR